MFCCWLVLLQQRQNYCFLCSSRVTYAIMRAPPLTDSSSKLCRHSLHSGSFLRKIACVSATQGLHPSPRIQSIRPRTCIITTSLSTDNRKPRWSLVKTAFNTRPSSNALPWLPNVACLCLLPLLALPTFLRPPHAVPPAPLAQPSLAAHSSARLDGARRTVQVHIRRVCAGRSKHFWSPGLPH